MIHTCLTDHHPRKNRMSRMLRTVGYVLDMRFCADTIPVSRYGSVCDPVTILFKVTPQGVVSLIQTSVRQIPKLYC